ncbi:homeobox protein 4-like [Spodoptera frugiperda]|uniref:Homeobox protein 4-like n=1 Tax=Spodoptera frugiperda TaxID=7108 RepID=A0A9R0ERH5_SPOFR|nr:homeobox protein 4-like [Spodoptera frugiperda]
MVLNIVLSLSLVVLVSSNNGFQTYEVPNYQNTYITLPTNPPVENNPYLQINTAQNPIPQDNLQPFNIRQILLNRILSSPSVQTILDHNSNGYGANSVDCNSNPIEPSLRNNYEASPIDYERLNNDLNTKNKDNESNVENEGKRRKHKRRKNSKSRRKPDDNVNNDNHNETEDNNKETGKRPKKRSRRPKQDSSKDNQADNNENLDKNNTKKRKNKHNETNVEDSTTENPKPRRRHKKKHKSDANSTDTANLEQQLPQLRVINDELNLANFCEGITEECRQTRNLKKENIDIQKPIANLVDNFPNGFSFKTFQNLYNNPAMTNFLANYENIYKNMLYTNNPINEPRNVGKKKPKSTRKAQRKTTLNNNNSTVATNDKITPPNPINSNINETTEKPTQIDDAPQANTNLTTEAESINSIEKPIDDKANLIDTKDLETDEPFLNYYDGYIDDYYPLFTDNAAYTANNREVYVKHMGDIKYYYTIDKNDPERFGLPGIKAKGYNTNKKYDEIEGIDAKDETKEEIVQFQTPPLLETPDFETRKVEIAEINPDAYYNKEEYPKTSTYSPAKHTEVKKNGLNTAEDKIETVFARSKVAKYGTAYKVEENEKSSVEAKEVKEELKEDSVKDGGTTYVIAKSLGYRY